jgi:hypothetical protein
MKRPITLTERIIIKAEKALKQVVDYVDLQDPFDRDKVKWAHAALLKLTTKINLEAIDYDKRE